MQSTERNDSLGDLRMSAEQSSVTEWLAQLKAGDRTAAQKLWEEYFRRLVGLARAKLGDTPQRAVDGEDVALSAFKSFYVGAEAGRFPVLDDRDNLWRLLVVITARKVYQLRAHQGRQKRGGNAVLDEAALAGGGEPGGAGQGLDEFLGSEPSPAFAAQAAEEYERLLALLPKDSLRNLAQWKMEGYTNEQIAQRLNCGLRSVERDLRLIRRYWEQPQ
jgi:DNA-directed RNA polymerase specialized sigma24 family protein